MRQRRFWIKAVVASAAALLPWHRSQAQQIGGGNNAAERLSSTHVAPLKDQLEKGLRATTPGQRQFVNVVVTAVNNRVLPRAMVNLVYRWALKRNSKIPFPYFEFALRALAKRRGINL